MPTNTSDLSIMERTFSETDSTSARSADCGMNPSGLNESRSLIIGSILASSAHWLRIRRAVGQDVLAGEDLLEEGGDAGGGIGADFLFFLAEHEEEAVQSFANNVLVDVEGGAFGEGDGLKLAG